MPRSNCHPQMAAFLDLLAYAEGIAQAEAPA